ncbi:hypothetical protein AYI70_g3985 [Smittium culicis]|uniref:Tetrapyrrole biosynthesis uroporphyrinogen III synthase domain-containing protein n=1 Tax=Smittium culicis TaxID=133412 RepID=A0A1R1Y114_9FUNG|nr:hypothetical protein AYI70_g3985 [Smittium culicis]
MRAKMNMAVLFRSRLDQDPYEHEFSEHGYESISVPLLDFEYVLSAAQFENILLAHANLDVLREFDIASNEQKGSEVADTSIGSDEIALGACMNTCSNSLYSGIIITSGNSVTALECAINELIEVVIERGAKNSNSDNRGGNSYSGTEETILKRANSSKPARIETISELVYLLDRLFRVNVFAIGPATSSKLKQYIDRLFSDKLKGFAASSEAAIDISGPALTVEEAISADMLIPKILEFASSHALAPPPNSSQIHSDDASAIKCESGEVRFLFLCGSISLPKIPDALSNAVVMSVGGGDKGGRRRTQLDRVVTYNTIKSTDALASKKLRLVSSFVERHSTSFHHICRTGQNEQADELVLVFFSPSGVESIYNTLSCQEWMSRPDLVVSFAGIGSTTSKKCKELFPLRIVYNATGPTPQGLLDAITNNKVI